MLCSVIVSSQNRAYEQEQLTMVLKHSITARDNFLVLLFVYFFGKIEIPYNLSFVAKVSKLLRPFYNVRFAKACREFEQDWRCVTPGAIRIRISNNALAREGSTVVHNFSPLPKLHF